MTTKDLGHRERFEQDGFVSLPAFLAADDNG